MTNESKLKKIIIEEIISATYEMMNGGNKEIIQKWLQSLQRIDEYCKERNRY